MAKPLPVVAEKVATDYTDTQKDGEECPGYTETPFPEALLTVLQCLSGKKTMAKPLPVVAEKVATDITDAQKDGAEAPAHTCLLQQ